MELLEDMLKLCRSHIAYQLLGYLICATVYGQSQTTLCLLPSHRYQL